jgi:methylmalonyl-CoA/ethylmalonyl-CoA epimerase
MDVFQIAQHADDLERAQRFYAMLLESEPTAVFDPPGLLFFHVGPVRLLLEQNAASSLIYLRVDDVATTVERLRAAGVAVVSEPHVIFRHTDDRLGPAGTDELMAFITDSEGNTVGLVSHTPSVDPAG